MSGGQQTIMSVRPSHRVIPLTKGEACIWARRFRRLGFSPVTIRQDDDGDWQLRCSFPYDPVDLPEDLNEFLFGPFREYDPVWWVGTRQDALAVCAKFRVVRRGMGSKPLPIAKQHQDPVGYEACNVLAGRIAYDSDDWPDTQRHPEWGRYLREEQSRRQNAPEPDRPPNAKRFACPCCGYYTLTRQPPGSHDFCPVCGWEDDLVQFKHSDFRGGANDVSLIDARRNFAAWGYAKERSKGHIRPPSPDEFPPE